MQISIKKPKDMGDNDMSKTTGKNGADESVVENVQPAAELTDD